MNVLKKFGCYPRTAIGHVDPKFFAVWTRFTGKTLDDVRSFYRDLGENIPIPYQNDGGHGIEMVFCSNLSPEAITEICAKHSNEYTMREFVADPKHYNNQYVIRQAYDKLDTHELIKFDPARMHHPLMDHMFAVWVRFINKSLDEVRSFYRELGENIPVPEQYDGGHGRELVFCSMLQKETIAKICDKYADRYDITSFYADPKHYNNQYVIQTTYRPAKHVLEPFDQKRMSHPLKLKS